MRIRRFAIIKRFSLPARLRASAFVTLLGIAVLWFAADRGERELARGLEGSLAATTAVLNQMAADMQHDALRGDVLLAMILGPEATAEQKDEVRATIAEHAAEFRARIDSLVALDLGDETRRAVDAVLPALSSYIAEAERAAATALTDRSAGRALLEEFDRSFRALEEPMERLGALIEEQGSALGAAALATGDRMQRIGLITTLVVTLVVLGSGYLLARSITRPIARIKQAVEEIASGNLGGRYSNFDRASDIEDEMSRLAGPIEKVRERLREALQMEATIRKSQAEQQHVVEHLSVGLAALSAGDFSRPIQTPFPAEYEALRTNYNATVDRLDSTVSQIVEAARQILDRADEIGSSSNDLSRRTESQAATLEETAATLTMLTGNVKSAAEAAREVERIVQKAGQEAEQSNKVVRDAIDAMTGIEQSSNQISRIIGVIDDIAFQTNLLALNAGVEAARAGEAGRGFAVVASEVRALAQRSSEASKEIKTLISASAELVGRGVDSVGSAGKALTGMMGQIGNITTQVSAIARSSAEQSAGLEEVNVGVSQLDQVAQKNAAMVVDSMNVTSALQSAAADLDALMSAFSTQTTASRHSAAHRASGASGRRAARAA